MLRPALPSWIGRRVVQKHSKKQELPLPRSPSSQKSRVEKMGQHEIDSESLPYHPSKLERKEYIGIGEFFSVDMRTGVVDDVQEFPEMRKPSYKIRVDFGPVVGKLWSSAQITNYSRSQLIGRSVVAAINLGEKTLPTGFVSQFLILGALDPDGTVKLLELPEGISPGSTVA